MATVAADRSTEFYDESLEPDGTPRPGYAEIFDAVAATGARELSRRVEESMQRIGATFSSDDGAQAFAVCPIPRLISAREWGWLEDAAGGRDDAAIALLTDGPSNSAWWEHRTLARRLGVSLVTPDKLRLQKGRLCMLLPSGRLRPLDVVYRRTDEDRLRDEKGRPTWLAELLLEPVQRGLLTLVNSPGAGVADDKL